MESRVVIDSREEHHHHHHRHRSSINNNNNVGNRKGAILNTFIVLVVIACALLFEELVAVGKVVRRRVFVGFPLYDTGEEVDRREAEDANVWTMTPRERDEEKQREQTSPVFITFSDFVGEGVCAGVETALLRGIELNVIGVKDAKSEGEKNGFALEKFAKVKTVKSRKMYGFLEALTEREKHWEAFGIASGDTIVNIADASDVLYFQDGATIMEKYKQIVRDAPVDESRKHTIVLVGAERNCWPSMDGERELVPGGRKYCEQFKSVSGNSSYHFLNSGSLMGRVDAVKALLKRVEAVMEEGKENDDDQQLLQMQYERQIKQKNEGGEKEEDAFTILLDHKASIFQTGWGSHLADGRYAARDPNGAYYNEAKCAVENTEHNSEPSIIHFNGGKVALFPVARRSIECFSSSSSSSSSSSLREEIKSRYPWFETQCAATVGATSSSSSSSNII